MMYPNWLQARKSHNIFYCLIDRFPEWSRFENFPLLFRLVHKCRPAFSTSPSPNVYVLYVPRNVWAVVFRVLAFAAHDIFTISMVFPFPYIVFMLLWFFFRGQSLNSAELLELHKNDFNEQNNRATAEN